MANLLDSTPSKFTFLGQSESTGIKTGFALDAVFVYGVSGVGLGFRWVAPTTTTVTDIWFFVTTTAGTPGVTTVLLCDYGASTLTPGAQVTNGSVTVSPGTTANKWIKATFATPPNVVKGNVYWVILGDASWTLGNTATVMSRAASPNVDVNSAEFFRAATSADSFLTAGTNVSTPPGIVVKFGDGKYLGNAISTTGTWTSNTLERGLKLAGLTESLVVSGVAYRVSTTYGDLKVYEGSTAPGGTIFSGFNGGSALTLTTGSKAIGLVMFDPVTLAKSTVYRFVFTFGSATSSPTYFTVEDSATYFADLAAVCPLGGNYTGCVDNGAGGWTDYNNSSDGIRVPQMALIVRDQITVATTGLGFSRGANGGMLG
jgi:hypothetical protein